MTGDKTRVEATNQEVGAEGEETVVLSIVEGTGDQLEGTGEQVEGTGDQVEGTGDQLEGTREQLEGPREQVEGTGEQVEGTGEQLEGPGEQVERTGHQVEGTGEQLEEPGEQVEGTGQQVEGTDQQLEGTDQQLEETRQQVENAESETQVQQVSSSDGNLPQQVFVEENAELQHGGQVIHATDAIIPEGATVIDASAFEDGDTAVLEDGSTVVRISTVAQEHHQTVKGATVVATAEHIQDGADSGVEQYAVGGRDDVEGNFVTTQEVEGEHVRLVRADAGPEVLTVQGVIQTQGGDANQQTPVRDTVKKAIPPPTVKLLSSGGGAPIGSSLNPIRIVQQGNQYTSVQQLDTDQLQQIIQVVQQQQQHVQEGGDPSQTVIYNPDTQTRIVYRVIYPSELHKSTPSQGQAASASKRHTIQIPKNLLTVSPALPRRQYRKRKLEDDERLDNLPELSKEEKEAKKNTRPKTRFGRVSKPPKHMVKDYKHIHLVDWDEDYDDSDGGYSDYRASGSEGDEEDNAIREFYQKNLDSEYMHPGLKSTPKGFESLSSTTKPRNHKCKKCDKAYIGQGGLARHYRMNPDHDILGEGDSNDATEAEDRTENGANNNADNGTNGAEEKPATPSPERTPGHSTPPSDTTPSLPRAVLKARQMYAQETTPAKRKARLKELMRQCDDEELMEVVLPRLSKVITTYEYLLMRVERGRPLKPHIQDVLVEFDKLHQQVAKMCEDYLKPLHNSEAQPAPGQNILQVSDNDVAQSLGLSGGSYEILDQPGPAKTAPQFKILTSEGNPAKTSNKRSVEMVSPEQITANPAKKARTENVLKVTSEGLKIISNDVTMNKTPPAPPGGKTDYKPSGNITVVRAPTGTLSNPALGNANQGRVIVVNPQTDARGTVRFVGQVAAGETAKNSSSSTRSNTTKVLVGPPGREVRPAGASREEATAKSDASAEKARESGEGPPDQEESEGNQVELQVVTMETTDAGGGGDGGGYVTVVQETSGETRVVQQGSAESAEIISQEVQEGETVHQIEVVQQEQVVDDAAVVQHAVIQDGTVIQDGAIVQDGSTASVTQDSTEAETEVVQQDLLPGQILEVRDSEGRILHVTAGENGELIQVETDEQGVPVQESVETTQVITQHQESQGEESQPDLYQTEDGVIFVQHPDGTIQVHGHSDGSIPLETVQALLAMESEQH